MSEDQGRYVGHGEWGELFAAILNKREGKATDAEVDAKVKAVLERYEVAE